MEVYLHTDHNITGHEALTTRVVRGVKAGLADLEDRVTRVDVHLSDESARRHTGNDLRCLLDAKLVGQAHVTATDDAATVDEALSHSIHRLRRLLESRQGRIEDRTPRASIRAKR